MLLIMALFMPNITPSLEERCIHWCIRMFSAYSSRYRGRRDLVMVMSLRWRLWLRLRLRLRLKMWGSSCQDRCGEGFKRANERRVWEFDLTSQWNTSQSELRALELHGRPRLYLKYNYEVIGLKYHWLSLMFHLEGFLERSSGLPEENHTAPFHKLAFSSLSGMYYTGHHFSSS